MQFVTSAQVFTCSNKPGAEQSFATGSIVFVLTRRKGGRSSLPC